MTATATLFTLKRTARISLSASATSSRCFTVQSKHVLETRDPCGVLFNDAEELFDLALEGRLGRRGITNRVRVTTGDLARGANR
jgi:hypothetical protein